MLAEVFENISQEEIPRRILREFGYYLGRWVYMIDAADDLSEDLESGSFNPFINQMHLTSDSTEEQIREARVYCNEALNLTLSRLIEAFNLLEFQQFKTIISNIILLGLPQMQKERLFDRKKEKNHV